MKFGANDIDLTEGTIWKQLTRFALPLLLGNVFQQLYNTVDTIVLGKYVDKQALAAVGMVGSAINALIGFFIAIAGGAGVVVSQFRGAHDDKRLSDAVHTTMVVALVACVVCTVLGVLSVPLLIKMMNTPPDAEEYAKSYLTINFSGDSGLLIYNMDAGIMRADGDSKRQLKFLIFTTILNMGLDLLFVLRYNMKVAGVAYATVISQCVSAVMVMTVLMRTKTAYRIIPKRLRMDIPIAKRIFKIGLPAAIQAVVTSISNVFVQGYINAFGSDCAAGWTAYGKVDQFALLPINSLSLASTTFVGQNLGAGNLERAKRGVNITMLMCFGVCALLCVPMIIFRRSLIGIFNKDEMVLYYGSIFLLMMSPFYILCAINQIYSGALRGAGISTVPMAIMLLSFVAFRQLYLFVFSHITDSFGVVALAYPMGWILCSTLMLIYYYKSHWDTKFLQPRKT